MIKIITAPEEYDAKDSDLKIFLAGSIDNGSALDWQSEICNYIESYPTKRNVVIFNPRRKNWNKAADKNELSEQITWELNALEKSNYIIMNILGESKSPITLLELGLFHKNKGLHVFCPNEFYRFMNVKLVCERYGVNLYETDKVEDIKKLINLIL